MLGHNSRSSKSLEKLSAGPVFTSSSRSHNVPVPILAKPANPNASRQRLCTSGQETTLKKLSFTLDEMKVKLTSVQSKVTSLEARFASVYGDQSFVPNSDPCKVRNGVKPSAKLPPRRSQVLNSSRFWASKRLACRLVAEKLHQEEARKQHASSSHSVAVRRSRRFASSGAAATTEKLASAPAESERLAPVTKAKIAKLLMDARLEMAAEEKERLEVHTSGALDEPNPPQACNEQQKVGRASIGRNEPAPLPPILPLLNPNPGAPEACEPPPSVLPVADDSTSAVRMPATSSPKPSSPCLLPQLPPIPAKYRRPMLLDTSEIARQTKDMLLKCAISQRSFGQNVLGLSQGSVSDLLTRPKPWSMLTNKGREPFIRMKLFLENPRSLNGFEYNITSGKDGASSTATTKQSEKLSEASPKSPRDLSSDVSSPSRSVGSTPSATDVASTSTTPALTAQESGSRSTISICSPEGQRLLKDGFDVMKTVADAKVLLNTTSMTQRALGNTVLGLSQASVSDLLCKCRPWDQISGNKPRESYVRLKLWVDSVRLTSGVGDGDGTKCTERSAKRQRTDSGSSATVDTETRHLNEQQLDVLVNFFDQCPQPDTSDLSELAKQIGCPLGDVVDWFEKRRLGRLSNPTSCVKQVNSQIATDRNGFPAASLHQSPTPTAAPPHSRRKRTVPTRILPPPSASTSEASRGIATLPPPSSSSSSSS
ncbi:unnamed protein product [Mesocestoides corti]|uniref:DNA-binding protein SATB n=1 Tax=Mesocestoides corti TaxID=53468 RepID=A0A158QSI5_MESCO|nr:unnamed protein product [Mesocestoides corti]